MDVWSIMDGSCSHPRPNQATTASRSSTNFKSWRAVGNIQNRLSKLKFSVSVCHVDCPRNIISGLAELIARSPQLVHLEVNLDHHYCKSPKTRTPTLHDVLSKVPEDHPLQLTHLALNRTGTCIDSFTLVHLRSLISLDVRNLRPPSTLMDDSDADLTSERLDQFCSTSDICAILKQEGIYLKHVIVSDVGAYDYLCSYSGLETLDLCFIDFRTVEESNTSAHTFFKFVLPQLVHSLQVLKTQPFREGQWCFILRTSFSLLYSPNAIAFDHWLSLWSLHQLSNRHIISTSSKTILMMRYVLVISLINRQWHKGYCRSHHSSTYRSAYPPSVRFILYTLAGIRE